MIVSEELASLVRCLGGAGPRAAEPACPWGPGSGMRLVGLVLVIALCTGACQQTPEAPREVPMPFVSSKPAPSWEAKLGQVVTVEGKAEDAKLGAVLTWASDMIWIDGLNAWPGELRGKHVQVTGKVVQR